MACRKTLRRQPAGTARLPAQNNPEAQYNLGTFYESGQGVPQDYAQAVDLYRRAANQGLAAAQFNLGLLYDNGQGVDRDYAQAAQWYLKAAEQGLPRAQYNLGTMYANGQGVAVNLVEAYFWLDLAAGTWNGRHRQEAIQARDTVAAHLSAGDLSKAQERATKWQADHQK